MSPCTCKRFPYHHVDYTRPFFCHRRPSMQHRTGWGNPFDRRTERHRLRSNYYMERIELSVADGTNMTAHVARPRSSNQRTPGIIVFQEAFGVNAHIRDVTQRFADLGFTAVAPELFHRTAPGFEGSYTDFESVRVHMGALKNEGLIADAQATYAWLTSDDATDASRLAAIGFCMGGRVAYLANAHLNLQAAISFYGGGIAPDLLTYAEQQSGPILMFWGGRDQHIPPEQYRAVADALTAADKTHEQVVFSQAHHAFFCDARASYDAGAGRQAWVLTQEFLKAFGVL